MTFDIEEKVYAKDLMDCEVGDAYEHLDAVRTYNNPITAIPGLKDEYNLRHHEAAKLFKSWADTYTGSEADDLWDRVEAGMKLLKES